MKFRKKQADMGSRLQKALVMEQKAQQILLELKDEIICDVKAAGPIPGVEIPDSVSYTHLDVYKRQSIITASRKLSHFLFLTVFHPAFHMSS